MGNIFQSEKRTHRHPKLQSSKPYKYKNEQYIKNHIQLSSKQQYLQWEKQLVNGPASKTQYAFIPLLVGEKSNKKQQSNESNLHIVNKKYMYSLKCNHIFQAQLLFPSYWEILSDQLDRRRTLDQDNPDMIIQQLKIWQLLKGLCEIAALYHQFGMKMGDIRPNNILFSDSQLFKVICRDSWPEQTTNYEKTVSTEQITYLSPEEQHEAIIGYKQQITSYEAGEAFSIGLTCLECVVTSLRITSCSQLYGIKQQLKISKLELKIKEMFQKAHFYSQILKITILCLLEFDVRGRIRPQQIHRWLNNKQFTKQNTENPDFLLADCPKKILVRIKNTNPQSHADLQIEENNTDLMQENQLNFIIDDVKNSKDMGEMGGDKDRIDNDPLRETELANKNSQEYSECENMQIQNYSRQPSSKRGSAQQKQQNLSRDAKTDNQLPIQLRPTSFWGKSQRRGKRINSRTLASFY